jgi:hypothetical protein
VRVRPVREADVAKGASGNISFPRVRMKLQPRVQGRFVTVNRGFIEANKI